MMLLGENLFPGYVAWSICIQIEIPSVVIIAHVYVSVYMGG